MALIRSNQVTGGDPLPIRVANFATRMVGDQMEAPAPDADLAEREAYLLRAVERLNTERAEFEASKEGVLEAAREDAERIREQARAQGETEASKIVAAAEEKAEGIIAVAETEGERIREQANNLGFATGMQQAQTDMEDAIAELRSGLATILEDAEEQRAELIRATEEQLLELGLEAARKMTARALKDEDIFVAVLREALSRMLDKEWVKLRVSQSDVERVREMEAKILGAIDGLDRIEVVDDPRVEHGPVVETRHGTVDATLAGQMRELLDSIDRALEAAEEEADEEGLP
jgi:flagellar assembly protein FliH